MDLRQLEYFVAVADELSFSVAGRRLRVAQPAVSQQIRRLERELHEPLFSRNSRSVTLTAAGETLLPHARATLAAAARAKDAVAALHDLTIGALTIGLVQAQPDTWITALLGDYHRLYPKIRIVLLEDEPAPLLEAVADGRLDVALVGLVEQPPAGVQVVPVSVEPMVVAVPTAHRLAARSSVAVTDLADVDLATLVHGTGLRAVVEREFAQVGIAPRIAVETTDVGLVLDLVAHGIGVAVLPANVAAARSDLAAIPISPPLRRRIGLAHRDVGPMSPAGRVFLRLAADNGPMIERKRRPER